MVSWHMDSTVLILESSRLWLRRNREDSVSVDARWRLACQGPPGSRVRGRRPASFRATYTTGNTLGKTTLASARYSYRILWSKSSVEYFTCVA